MSVQVYRVLNVELEGSRVYLNSLKDMEDLARKNQQPLFNFQNDEGKWVWVMFLGPVAYLFGEK